MDEKDFSEMDKDILEKAICAKCNAPYGSSKCWHTPPAKCECGNNHPDGYFCSTPESPAPPEDAWVTTCENYERAGGKRGPAPPEERCACGHVHPPKRECQSCNCPATVGIYRCPEHPKFWAVIVNDTRITPSKCCGRWELVKEWKGVKVTHGY